ncbi:MAG TPA: trypsin-like peptidase domain-containing protein, partial [Actinomycetes bacterium]|nr:trypsin-like peptidase domain-containing protein [Actinomycetes bacterium]
MRDWDAAPGIDPERVAEVLVTTAGPGPERRGSGYRVSPTSVLTAAHVVAGAARVRVRFDADRPGEWVAEATVAWDGPDVDAAVVEIRLRDGEEPVVPAGFGRVAERDAVVAASAMGFPRFKLRQDEAGPPGHAGPAPGQGGRTVYRDSAHVTGTVAVLSNRRQGTLEVTVAPPERDPDPARSPWEGMSGAAVWSGGRIIGLVAEHHLPEGPGRLTATRVDGWYERLPAERLERLRALLGLPARAAELADVVPVPTTELLQASYLAQVRDLAPERLVEREAELEELVRFCAGEEPYRWLHGPPWAGKSALAAWFVLHPPAGVTVVSFFVTRRLVGQTDSNAFTEAMVEQLAAVTGEPPAGSATPAGRDRARRHLLDQAAQRAAERGQRLLVVVDGLDEDQGARPGSGLPSIASLLPERPPEAVRVMVTSRPHPGIPDDVPGDHPLRHCAPRLLATSRAAHHIEVAAKHELVEQLHGDRVQFDILGLITAGGGGLTLGELGQLTGQPRVRLAGRLRSVFGRSLMARTPYDQAAAGGDERVYLFAHETLRAIAEEELGGDLGPYRARIDAWVEGFRERGWPDDTPQYPLRPYGRLLATSGDLGRLVE